MIKIITTIFVLLAMASLAFSQTPLSSKEVLAEPRNRIQEISIEGLNKTKPYVVFREILLKKGQLFDDALLEESLQRLKNLRIFTEVKANVINKEAGVIVTISMIEKWTTIPIARFGGGGGTAFYILGVYDINSFGRYLELGGQYENLGGRDAGVVWFRDPRFLNEQLLVGLELWSIIRNQELHDRTGALAGAYTLSRQRIRAFAEFELHPIHTIGLGIEWDDDRLSDSTLSNWFKDLNDECNFRLEDHYQTITINLNYQLGELDYEDYLVEGIKSTWDIGITRALINDVANRRYINWQTQLFRRLGYRQNIGLNLKLGVTDATIVEQQYKLGGLTDIRGYANNQFVGKLFWQSNLEYRFSSIHTSWFALQHVVFADATKVSSSVANLVGSAAGPYYSVGTGIRLISPRVFRFVFRLDLAKTIGPIDNVGIAFGVQQFF